MRILLTALFCAGLLMSAAHADDLTGTTTQTAKDSAKEAIGNYLGIKPTTPAAKETGKQQLTMEPSSSGKSLSETNSTDSSADLAAINAKMHHAMDIKLSGNADRDFVASMIPHHQGAIDMAKYVLENGDDPAVRKLAQGIIKSQHKEIAQMQDWLKKFDAKKKVN